MTDRLDRAADRLNALQRRRPDAVRLARVACLAVRVEPALLRRLRLTLLPDVDVGTEADFWFSPLIESRGTTGVVLHKDVAALLRAHLANEPTVLERAIAATALAHEKASAAIRLEEQVTALALLHGDAGLAEIDAAFRPALRAVKESDARALEMARWMVRAAAGLPRLVWRTPNAYALLYASSIFLGGRRVLADLPAGDIELDAVAWALPASALETRVPVGVELFDDAIQFEEASDGGATIQVPQMSPPIVEIRWLRGHERFRTLTDSVPGRIVELGVPVSSVTIRTVAGDVFAIGQETARTETTVVPTHLSQVYIGYSHNEADTALARYLAARLRTLGISVWMDESSLSAGSSLQEDIGKAIAGSDCAIFLVSMPWLVSSWGRFELDRFSDSERAGIRRVPVFRLSPERLQIPPELIDVKGITWLEGEADADARFWELYCAITNENPGPAATWSERGRKLGSDAAESTSTPRPSTSPSWKPEKARLLATSWMDAACVRVELLGSNGPAATGFFVGPLLIVTAAEPFRGTPMLAIDRGSGRGGQARVINPETTGDILLLQPLEQGLHDTPLRLTTKVTERQSRTDAEVLIVPSTARVTLVLTSGPISVEAKPHLLHNGSAQFDVDLPERQLPQEFMGAPIVIGDAVAGVVTGLSANFLGASTLRATGSIVVQRALDQYQDRSSTTTEHDRTRRRVYLIYAREDLSSASQIRTALNSSGVNVSYDPNADPDANQANILGSSTGRIDCVVALWSRGAATAEAVTRGIGLATSRGLPVVAVLIDDGSPPTTYSSLRVVNLAGWQSDKDATRFRKLVDAIEEAAQGAAAGDNEDPAS